MTRSREAMAVAVVLTSLAAFAIVSALSLGPVARRMPLVVAVPTLALLVVEIVRIRRSGADAEAQPRGRDERRLFAWIGGLLLLVLALGISAGVPAFLLAFVRGRFGERWRTAIAMALAMAVLLFAGLEQGLGIRLHTGLAGSWLEERGR
jgi:hypothetical protein